MLDEAQQEFALDLVLILGLALAIIGVIKMALWLIGEYRPRTWRNLKSDKARRFMTGSGNRLVFGLGGLLTAGFGGACVLVVWLLRWLADTYAL